MVARSRVLGVVAGALAAGALGGCGSSLSSRLKDPGVGGVEALRGALRVALADRDERAQCQLFAGALLDSEGGSVAACARSLEQRWLPYMGSPKAYVAGGRIELRGNEASYLIPFGQVPSEDPSEFETEAPQIAFTAVYTEGSWKVVERTATEAPGI